MQNGLDYDPNFEFTNETPVKYVPQKLTEDQKAVARANIGAAEDNGSGGSGFEVPTVSIDAGDTFENYTPYTITGDAADTLAAAFENHIPFVTVMYSGSMEVGSGVFETYSDYQMTFCANGPEYVSYSFNGATLSTHIYYISNAGGTISMNLTDLT